MLTEEKEQMSSEMSDMMGKEFMGEMKEKTMSHKDCAIMGLIKNRIALLEEQLDEAYNKLGRVSTDEENWSAKYERKMDCKILESQIAILNKLQRDFENMLTPMIIANQNL